MIIFESYGNLTVVDIRSVVEYKNFLFIKVNRGWLVIKTDEKEKEMILSKIKERITIQFIQKEEPFDLRKIR